MSNLISIKKFLGFNNQKVIVYQMGKVASRSIDFTLRQINGIAVTHAHHLSTLNAHELNDIKRKLGWEKISCSPKRVERTWNKLKNDQPLKIITLVREPIGRNISAYFQNLDHIYGRKNAHIILSQNELVSGFFQKYPHQVPLTWFDNEFKNALDVDIYEYTFPQKKGVSIINNGTYEILVMRHDLDDSLKQKYIAKLLGVENVTMKKANTASTKPYHKVYKEFKDSIHIPDEYIHTMLDSKYACHFYTNDELELLKQKWKTNHIPR